MKTTQILIAGFGGQGILFAGKFLAYKGLLEDLQVSWLPSYGPEMRGGTANCNVILSDDPVGSPIITDPDVLIVMNLPSLQKYVDTVVPADRFMWTPPSSARRWSGTTCRSFTSLPPRWPATPVCPPWRT